MEILVLVVLVLLVAGFVLLFFQGRQLFDAAVLLALVLLLLGFL